jgi:hypothetical protein
MFRLALACLALLWLVAPARAQPVDASTLGIELALERCNDGIHPIENASVGPSTIVFRAGPRDVFVFFGLVHVGYAEVGGTGPRHPREARLMLGCDRSSACVRSGPWSAEMAAARAEQGIVPLSALPVLQSSLAVYCPDLHVAQALHKALLAIQRPVRH